MLLRIGWMMFGIEIILVVLFGFILWFMWSRSAMERTVARTAMTIYIIGSIVCLSFTVLLPL